MNKFRVLFNGRIREGFDEGFVKDIFAQRFSITDIRQINTVFSGGRIEINAGLSSIEAEKLSNALAEIGLIVEIDPPLVGEDKTLSTMFQTLPNSDEENFKDACLATAFITLPDVVNENLEDETLATIFKTLPDIDKDEKLDTLFITLPNEEAEQTDMDFAGMTLGDLKKIENK